MSTTSDDVWRLLGELIEAQQETRQLLKQQSEEAALRSQEADRRSQETDRLFQEAALRSQETDRQFQETALHFRETEQLIEQVVQENRRVNQKLSEQLGALGGKWGLFVENMVAPACETLFVKRGIPVHQVSQRVKKRYNGETMEIDVLVLNQNHALIVEVKSSLGVQDVKDFVVDLGRFREFFPEYANRQIYGAVAGIAIESEADRYAYRQGLFVLTQSGETMIILNNDQFRPRAW